MRPRVDPRARAPRVSPTGRPRTSRLGPTSSRIDPHLEARARLRREFRTGAVAFHVPEAGRKPLHRPQEGASLVLVLAIGEDLWPSADADLLGAAREIWPDHAICLGIVGDPTCDPETAGADRVLRLRPGIGEDGLLASVRGALDALSPAHVVLAEGGVSGDLARRIVARAGVEGAFNVAALRQGQVTRLLDGGRSESSGAPPFLLALPRAACAPFEGELRFEARGVEAPIVELPTPVFADEGLMPLAARDVPLLEADLVLSAGAGVTDWDTFFTVAEAISAAVAGSRVVCDAGHLPRERQVGASGKLIEAGCYVALGISGAPQHLQGIQGCRRVVAVNTDPHAPILARADLAILGDAQAVLSALRDELRREVGP